MPFRRLPQLRDSILRHPNILQQVTAAEHEGFCKKLEEFETATSVDVYLNAICNEDVGEVDEELKIGFSEMAMKINKPSSECTLHEVRKLNKAIIKKSTLCSHSIYIGAVSRICVVVRLRFPSSAVGWVLAAITPGFMTTHLLTELSVDGCQLTAVQAQRDELVIVNIICDNACENVLQ